MGAKYHTHASRFGGSCVRTVCGRHIDDVSRIRSPEWYRDHTYPEALVGYVCKVCEDALAKRSRDQTRVAVSPAQQHALECSGIIDAAYGEGEKMLAHAWDGAGLTFATADAEHIWRTLVELSNSEDAAHCDTSRDRDERTYAGRAARALSTLSAKIRF